MTERGNCCPVCGNKILARVDDRIFCLMNGCEWNIEYRREEDKEIPEIHTLEKVWGEV